MLKRNRKSTPIWSPLLLATTCVLCCGRAAMAQGDLQDQLREASQGTPLELPELVSRAIPELPPGCRLPAGASTIAIMKLLVCRDGRVRATSINEWRHGDDEFHATPALDQAAYACSEEWKFKPATVDGRPVARWTSIPVEFSHDANLGREHRPRPKNPSLDSLALLAAQRDTVHVGAHHWRCGLDFPSKRLHGFHGFLNWR